MKKLLLLFVFFFSVYSCEKDDICIDPITPNLIIRFYDNTDGITLKNVTDLQIKNTDIDSIYSNNIISSDSIAIPLNINQDSTTYVFTINSNDIDLANSDTLKISYTRKNVFVSRSCGFKTIFKNASLNLTTDGNNWIKSASFVEAQNTIDNESKAHVKILH
jgi:Family of unknown function (DUF6452)